MQNDFAVNEESRLPGGAVAAAVVLGLMAFVGLLVVASSAFALFMSRTPLIPHIPSVREMAAAVVALLLALVILAAVTIVGLFRLRMWARYSIMLLGALDFVVFSIMAAAVLITRVKSGMGTMTLPNDPHVTLGAILLWLALFYALLALIGVWWILYFRSEKVRRVFPRPDTRLTP